ncbi:hypothetical protein KSP39_PZI019047 [Platanthera zijinensis]|uniref:Uncharacterized protein n=1 Tax=Platanthera zijinensis TaxID=2320716 RepID=A0AAP0FXS4_9ASPA
MADNIAILNDEQLRRLAKLIYYQEVDATNNIKFSSEPELAKYLRDCKSNYDSVLGLLNSGGEVERKFQDDSTRAPISQDIFSYIVYCANSALQAVQNYTLRMNYLDKISKHATTLINGLQELDPENVINVRRLAKDAVLYRNAMLEYTRKNQSIASRNFSKWLKDSGLKFEELVERYVYEEIIEASGRGRVIVNQFSTAVGIAGIAVLLFTAGMMVWDIFSSEHILQAATRDAVVSAASIGGAMLGEVVGAALATDLVGVEASALFVLFAGIATSILGAFIIGGFVGWLIDLIIGSGGNATLSTDGLRSYVAPMPDGVLSPLSFDKALRTRTKTFEGSLDNPFTARKEKGRGEVVFSVSITERRLSGLIVLSKLPLRCRWFRDESFARVIGLQKLQISSRRWFQ